MILHRRIHVRSYLQLATSALPGLGACLAGETEDDQDPCRSSDAREHSLLSLFQHNNSQSNTTMRDIKRVHSLIIKSGFEQHVFVAGRLISFCSVSDDGCMDYAVSIFNNLSFPDAFLWNTMIRGFGRTARTEEAFAFFSEMRRRRKIADNFTLSFLLKISGQHAGGEIVGRQLHCCSVKHGLHNNVFVANTVVHMYGALGRIEDARQMFDEMPNKDVVSWNALLDSLVCCSKHTEALTLYYKMLESGFTPDDATFVVVLSACSELGDLDYGQRVHLRISNSMVDHFPSVANSLIDMYAKCGDISKAYEIFGKMKEKNIVSWNSMIVGLAMHGRTKDALGLFEKLQETGAEPNDITFVGVLSAFSHGGLIEEGRRYFEIMKREYSITPTIKHYGCMVDLLGRAGLVGEAYDLIKTMPVECNAIVWRTLLAACKVHGHVELGKKVKKLLGALDPQNSSDYLLLSHMLANAGRWSDVWKVRGRMRDGGVEKSVPGSSSIEV